MFVKRKECICGLAKVLSPKSQEKIANPQSVTFIFWKVRKSNKLFKSTNCKILMESVPKEFVDLRREVNKGNIYKFLETNDVLVNINQI
jgi:hypothetical protein